MTPSCSTSYYSSHIDVILRAIINLLDGNIIHGGYYLRSFRYSYKSHLSLILESVVNICDVSGKILQNKRSIGNIQFPLSWSQETHLAVASNDPVDIPMCVVGFHGIHGYSTDTLKLPRNVLF